MPVREQIHKELKFINFQKINKIANHLIPEINI